MKRRTLLTLGGLGLAAAAFPVARRLWLQPPAGTTLFYAPPVMPTLLLAAAAKHGRLKEQLPFQIQTWKDVDVLRAGLANHNIGVSIVPSYTAANLAARGADVRLVNVMSFGMLYLVGSQPLSDLAALQGKKLIIPFKNDMPDLLLQILCRKRKIAFERLSVRYVSSPPEALIMFMLGQADYVLLPEPLVSTALLRAAQLGKTLVRALDIQAEWASSTGMQGIPQAGLLLSGKFRQSYPEAGALLLQDIRDAAAWAAQQPDQAAQLASDTLDLPAQAAADALLHSRLSAVSAQESADVLMSFFAELHQLNPAIIGGKMPDKTLFSIA